MNINYMQIISKSCKRDRLLSFWLILLSLQDSSSSSDSSSSDSEDGKKKKDKKKKKKKVDETWDHYMFLPLSFLGFHLVL